jgi:hypothetical protein
MGEVWFFLGMVLVVSRQRLILFVLDGGYMGYWLRGYPGVCSYLASLLPLFIHPSASNMKS